MKTKAAYWMIITNTDYVLLEDKAIVANSMSITNDAEAVVEDLIAKGYVKPNTLIYYIDTDGRVDRLLHDGIKFTGFQFGFDSIHEFHKQVTNRVK